MLGRTPMLHHALFEAVIRRLGGTGFLHHREDEIGGTRREFLAWGRAAGLNDYRITLRAARNVERPLHGKEAAFVVERAHLRGIHEGPGGLVRQQSVLIKTVPKATYHVDEFVGDLIAQVVLEMT